MVNIRRLLGQLSEWLQSLVKPNRPQAMRNKTVEHLSSTRERQRIVQGIRQFFEQNYELRYNVMKQTEEYRPRGDRKAAFDSLQAPLGNLQAAIFPTEAPYEILKAPYKNLQAPNSSTEAPGSSPPSQTKITSSVP
jgi:hypothetical protein